MKVVADLGADGADDFERKAGAVLERAAVLVLAVVDRRAEELREQVPVCAVQLHAVEAGLARPPRALGKVADDLLDLRHRCPLAQEAVQRVLLVGGRQALGVLDAVDVALPSAMAQLHDEFAVVLVHRVAEGTPEGDVAVVVDHREVRDDAAAEMHRHE